MAYQLGQARAELRTRIDEPTPAFFSDAQLNSWLNQGANDFARMTGVLLRYTRISLGASTQTFNLPGDCVKVLTMWFQPTGNPIRQVLQYVPPNDVITETTWGPLDPTIISLPWPLFWTTQQNMPGATVELYPQTSVPGQIILYYERLAGTAVNDTDILDCPDPFADAPIFFAEARCWRVLNDLPQFQAAMQEYQRLVNMALDTLNKPTRQMTYIQKPALPGGAYYLGGPV